jgi:hypothetical protein
LGLSVAARKAFNALYREKRMLAQQARVIFPPYPVALKRVEERADQINKLIDAGIALHALPLSFWMHVFGAQQQARSIVRTEREVQSLLAKHGAVPDRCDVCGTVGPVVPDRIGWLCESCHKVTSACGDPRVLHSIADYLNRGICKQNQATKDDVRYLRRLRTA